MNFLNGDFDALTLTEFHPNGINMILKSLHSLLLKNDQQGLWAVKFTGTTQISWIFLNTQKLCSTPRSLFVLFFLMFSPSVSFLSPFALFSFSPRWAVTDYSEWTVSLLSSQTINQLCTVSGGWLSQSDTSGWCQWWWGWCHQGPSESISVLQNSVGRCRNETVTWTPSGAGCYLNPWR